VGAYEALFELDEPLFPMFGQSCFARGAVAPGFVVVPGVVVDGVVEPPPAAQAAPAPIAATAANAATSVRTRIIRTSLSVPGEETAWT
jgi:hypothetical protein